MHGYKTLPRVDESSFIECRNFSNSKRGILGTMLLGDQTFGKVKAKLILTDGLLYDEISKEFMISYYEIRPGVRFETLITNISNEDKKTNSS